MNENRNENNKEQPIDGSVLGRIAAANTFWPDSANRQMLAMVEEIAKSNNYIQDIIGTGQSIPIKGGFVAEQMHAETYNLQNILENKLARAITDRNPEWSTYGLKHNDPGTDIAVVDGVNVIHKAQVKYYQDSPNTANAMRETRDGMPYYKDADSFIGPSDQVHPQDGSPSIADIAHKTRIKNEGTRPDVAEAAGLVENRITDRLNGTSRPVSKDEAHEVAKNGHEGKEIRSDYQDEYMTKSTIHQMQRAAASAAGIAAIMAGTLNTIQYLRLVREGKITTSEAIVGIVKNTATTAADSALKAGVAAGAVSVATRLSAETVAAQAVSSMVGKSGIAGAAVCAVDLIECMVMVAAGKMTTAEMETRTGKNILQTTAAVWGSSVGISVVSSLGASAGLATFMAGTAGGMIAGIAISIAIENHVEKPYREIMMNTEMLTETAGVMCDTAEAIAMGQKAFVTFLSMDKEFDKVIADKFKQIDVTGQIMFDAIEKLRR